MKTINLILAALIMSCTGKNTISTRDKNNSETIITMKDDFQSPDSSGQKVTNSVVHAAKQIRKITVGGSKADIQGFTSQAIQIAINALHDLGGGTVMLLPGNYAVIAPVKLYTNIALIGSGPSTILKKCKGVRTRFVIDADYGELKVTVTDILGFTPGMGILISDSDHSDGWDVTTAVITSIKDNTLYFDNYLVQDYNAEMEGTVSNTCSVISAVEADNVFISNLTVDGSRETNDLIDGCRGGGIYLHKVHNANIENVHVKDFNSDGISWQITENVTVRNCEVSGCASIGLHPGTGSPYTLIEGNISHNNDDYGLYVCWRVRNGTVRNNKFYKNGKNGISTGHKDTDMLYESNHIYENASDGVNLRNDGRFNSPHRSIFRNNLVENNGVKNGGYGFSVNCPAEGIILENNTIQNTKYGKQQAAVYLDKNSLPITMLNNIISGHPKGDVLTEK